MRVSVVLAIITLLVSTACDPSSITGSGSITTQTRSAAPFTAVDIAGSAQVIISYAPEYSIRVETDDNLQSGVSTDIANNTLRIRQSGTGYTKLTVHLTTPTISSINTHSTGSITVLDGFKQDGMIVYSDAPGTITLTNLEVTALTASISGTAEVYISGQAQTLSCQHRGMGTIHAFDFATKEAAIAVYNSGSAHIYASDRLYADILGSGNIVYKGNPHVTLTSKGSGTLTRQP